MNDVSSILRSTWYHCALETLLLPVILRLESVFRRGVPESGTGEELSVSAPEEFPKSKAYFRREVPERVFSRFSSPVPAGTGAKGQKARFAPVPERVPERDGHRYVLFLERLDSLFVLKLLYFLRYPSPEYAFAYRRGTGEGNRRGGVPGEENRNLSPGPLSGTPLRNTLSSLINYSILYSLVLEESTWYYK